jgi:putative transposase
MPRPRRLELGNVALHIVQRGNNRAACFFGDIERRFYLKCLGDAATRRNVAIHAYVLMTNHVHLLVTPREAGAASAMLQDIGRRYVRVINTIHGRTGTLWEGRFKSSLIEDDRYLLACHRYIELNPVRAGLVDDPAAYPWSSHAHYALERKNSLVTEHPIHAALGDSAATRAIAFKQLFDEPLDAETVTSIREAANSGAPVGTVTRKRGRPEKVLDASSVISGKLI